MHKTVLHTFGCLLILGSVLLLQGCSATQTPPATFITYVGAAAGDAEDGIYAFRFDPATGALTREGPATQIHGPSYLTLSPDRRYLYSVTSAEGRGAVSAFEVDPESGGLTFLNQQPSGGNGPAYISTDASGRWVLVANYSSGSVGLLPAGEDGRLAAPSDVARHTGSSVNPERQTAPHAHYVHVDPTSRFAFAVDLGIDKVRTYALDGEQGRLRDDNTQDVTTAPGAGPRHMDFHPNGRYAYLVNELNGTVSAYAYDAETGGMTELQTLSTLPETFDGFNKSADIHVHPSGKFLYASNRGDFDSIAIYAIDEKTGKLSFVGHQAEGIHWPRNFAIDPTGAYLLVANRNTNDVVVFSIDPSSGKLTATGHRAEVPTPMCIKFLAPSSR